MLHHMADQLGGLSDQQVQRYGKYVMAASIGYYLLSSSMSAEPADVKYTIDAHLPQGFDRSMMASRLQQRHNKVVLQKCLRITELRSRLRLETSREAKLQGWQEVFHLTLVGMLASTYTHSLTLSLFVIKNTVLALMFVLQRRAAKTAQPGRLQQVSTWWQGGTKAVLMEAVLQRVMSAEMQSASPFVYADLDEEVPLMDGRHGHPQTLQVEADEAYPRMVESINAEICFSVRHIVEASIPHIIACAESVVSKALNRRPAHAFSVSGITTAPELHDLLQELAVGMERQACVPAWVQACSLAVATAPPNADHVFQTTLVTVPTRDSTNLGGPATSAEDEEDDIVIFPSGSTAVLGPDGQPMRSRDPNMVQLEALFHDTPEDRRARAEATRSASIAKQQSAAYFQELIGSASFAELCVQYAADNCAAAFAEAGDMRSLKSYVPSSATAKMLIVVAALEGYRQRMLDASFEVQPSMKRFCVEVLRATCSQ